MALIRTSGGNTTKKAPKKYGKEKCAEQLRNLRKEKEVTQEEVAAFLHLSRSTIVKMETANQDIKAEYLFKLAQYYGTTADYILGLTEVRRAAETLPACDELGLSDTATVKLEEMRERELLGRVLSKLIEHDLFETMLWYIENAILSSEPSPCSATVDKENLTASAKAAGYSLIPSEAKKSYELYMASMTLQAIIADVSDSFFPSSTALRKSR